MRGRFGPRAGIELLQGQLATTNAGEPNEVDSRLKATHWFVGGVVGMRAGFRHIHGAIEGGFSFHRADAHLGGAPLTLQQLAITPGGALLVQF